MKTEAKRNIFGEQIEVVHGSPAITREFKKLGFVLNNGYTKEMTKGDETWKYNSLQNAWVKKVI